MATRSEAVSARSVGAIRAFNRVYTQKIGILGQGLLGTPFSLTEARTLFELAARTDVRASDLVDELAIDFGYLSRILARFEERGLLQRERAAHDKRQSLLRLTAKGRRVYRMLDGRAGAEIRDLLRPLPHAAQRELEGHLTQARRILAAERAPLALREPRAGDLGWIVQRHGELYMREYGLDATFEGLVARICADYAAKHDPARERCWIAERAGRPVGSILLVRKRAKLAQLRLLLVEPSERGAGTGGTLVDTCVGFAREAGYAAIELWTQKNLTAARKLYRRAGFERIASEARKQFGTDVVNEIWRLALR